MKSFSLKKLLVRYKMYFGPYFLYVSIDIEHKVLSLYFGDKSTFDKLIDAVIKARGHFSDVSDDFSVNALCGPDCSIIPLGYFKDLSGINIEHLDR